MGKKVKWFSSVKKAFSPDSKKKKEQPQKLDESNQKASSSSSVYVEPVNVPHPPPEPEGVTLTEVENEQDKSTHYSVAEVAREDVRLTSASRFAGKSKEEVAAIRIQTAFRGYMARRALRALRGLVRLKTLMEGAVVKRQASNTLRCMQTLSRLQSQIRTRRIIMAEENQALQKQLLQKHAKELASMQMGDNWDDSLQSKEQIEASLLSKYEAAGRRERAMAYAFTHQQNSKNSSSRSVNPMFMDPRNPTWGWSWLERWMAARPWENRNLADKELNSDRASVNSVFEGEISKSYAKHQLNSNKQSPTLANQKPSQSPRSPLTPAKRASKSAVRNLKPASPRGIIVKSQDDDTRSVISVQSSKGRRHSFTGSSVRDDESQAGSPNRPSYMGPTQSMRAKSRLQSPTKGEENGKLETEPLVFAKKRLSYPPTPPTKPRRHSGPPKVNSSVIVDGKVNHEVDS